MITQIIVVVHQDTFFLKTNNLKRMLCVRVMIFCPQPYSDNTEITFTITWKLITSLENRNLRLNYYFHSLLSIEAFLHKNNTKAHCSAVLE